MKKIQQFVFAALVATTVSAGAQSLSWDPNASNGTSLGGTGNWDTISPLWFNNTADVVWANGADANFTGTAGTVTLANSLSAADLYFTNTTGNYFITNATGVEVLSVANTIDTGTNEETIAAPNANSSTLNINGTGRLHFVVANSLNNVMINQGTLSMENTNLSIGGSATVANGAALEVAGDATNLLGVDGVDCVLTLNGTGINNGGALRIMSGLDTWLEQIILGTNTTIYANTNTAFLYDGSDSGTPMTD